MHGIQKIEDYKNWTAAQELAEYGEEQGFTRIMVGNREVLPEEVLADVIQAVYGEDVEEVIVEDIDAVRYIMDIRSQ